MSDSISENDKAAFLETLKGLRIMDDVFMNEFVKRDREDGYAAPNVILKAFTGLNLKVRTAEVQSILTSAGGRSIWLLRPKMSREELSTWRCSVPWEMFYQNGQFFT